MLLKGLWDMIVDFFNLIPKSIYFLYATLASAVDAMQALIRKLAGLDVYYQVIQGQEKGTAVAMRDPLTEFVYGILGFGDNAAAYKALNTVFWSLAVFGLILLIIATIVAIIKSHYNEDTAGTSPWKYVYSAIKAVLTFAIIPFVTVVGLGLASFILRTLDNITAGSGSNDTIVGLYGTQATQVFVSSKMEGSDYESYIHYDFFGAGGASTSSTFGGMLFKAASTGANRVRNGDKSYKKYQHVQIGATEAKIYILGIPITTGMNDDGTMIFGSQSCSAFTSLKNDTERKEYVASQIDYAFANNLHIKESIKYSELKLQTGISVSAVADLFAVGTIGGINSFSKFNVAVVWQFYNLWLFSFVVAFAGVFATFTILISIVMGMMGRLIKGAALFIVYPALLGLAPLDNFKAFKGWGTKFMSLVFTALGSIVGINLLFLIIPFITEIQFFGVYVVDKIVEIIMLVVGLMMAKDFVSMISELVGTGDNALTSGESLKGQVSGSLKKGVSMTAKAGIGAAKITTKAGVAIGKGAGKFFAKATASKRAQKAGEKAAESRQKALESGKKIGSATHSRNVAMDKYMDKLKEDGNTARYDYITEAGNKAAAKAKKKGLSDKEIEQARRNGMAGAMMETASDDPALQEKIKQVNELSKTHTKNAKSAKVNSAKEEAIKKKYGLKENENYVAGSDEKGKKNKYQGTVKGAWADLGKSVASPFVSGAKGLAKHGKAFAQNFMKEINGTKIGTTIADVFMKTTGEAASGMGFDKTIKAAAEILTPSLTIKNGALDKNRKDLSGDALVKQNAAKQETATNKTNELLQKLLDQQAATKKATDASVEASKKVADAVKESKPSSSSGDKK